MKYYILYNPLAGNKSCKEKLSELEEFCGADAVYIDVVNEIGIAAPVCMREFVYV